MAYEIIWEEQGILIKHSGTVTEKEVNEANGKLYGDRRFEKIEYQIADYTNVTNNLLRPKEAKVIGELDKSSARWNQNRMRLAIVTQDENFFPVVHSYFKVFEGTSWEGRIFNSLEEAYRWVKDK